MPTEGFPFTFTTSSSRPGSSGSQGLSSSLIPQDSEGGLASVPGGLDLATLDPAFFHVGNPTDNQHDTQQRDQAPHGPTFNTTDYSDYNGATFEGRAPQPPVANYAINPAATLNSWSFSYPDPNEQGRFQVPYYEHSQSPKQGMGQQILPYESLAAPEGFQDPVPYDSYTYQAAVPGPQRRLRPREKSINYAEDEDFRLATGDQHDGRVNEASPSPKRGSKTIRSNRRPAFPAEKPRKDSNKPWVRTNATTKGQSTRTGKINNFSSPYQDTAHPWGNWVSPNNNSFAYTAEGELKETCYSSDKIRDFIYSHPLNKPTQNSGRLIMWIQKHPGDSGRRFPTEHGSKCRFDACPLRIFKHRTIAQGHFQVAFDDQYATYGNLRDPLHVAGYVHLYCLERFTDFADICRRFDVRADERDIATEPRGTWSASLGRETDEFNIADRFIKDCKDGSVRRTVRLDYPPHLAHAPERPKHHAATLTCDLFESKKNTTNRSKLRMMEARGAKETNYIVNLGDLEMHARAHQRGKAGRRGKKQPEDAAGEDHSTNPDSTGRSDPSGERGRSDPNRSRSSTIVRMQGGLDLNADVGGIGPAPVAPMIGRKRAAEEAGVDDDEDHVARRLRTEIAPAMDPDLDVAHAVPFTNEDYLAVSQLLQNEGDSVSKSLFED